jgi:hypothetical protein
MKRITHSLLVAVVAFGLAGTARAEKADKKEAQKANPAFETLKSLAGTWSGKASSGPMKDQTIRTKFRVTSGGTAVEEVLLPGTNHEMVDMYYPEGDGLTMVHYCAMGNQPRLKMSSSKGKKLVFTYVDGSNIPSPDSPHMSGLTLTVKGDKLVEDWSSSGMKDHENATSFQFAREK